MKTLPLILAVVTILAASGSVNADKLKKGYVTKGGTYVAPHYQTAPNSTKLDNYSSKGNTNPYTGKGGTVDPFKPSKPSKR